MADQPGTWYDTFFCFSRIWVKNVHECGYKQFGGELGVLSSIETNFLG